MRASQDPDFTLEEQIERRTLLEVRTFITRHGPAQVDAYCMQRLHDIRMDAKHQQAKAGSRLAASPPSR